MTIKYFGKVAELTNRSQESWDCEGMTISEFENRLKEAYPELANDTIQIAVNLTIAKPDFLIKNTDEIAILPPFSGG